MRYLGLDLGSRTLGISISDNTGLIASSYKTIRHNEEYDRLLDEVVNIVKEKLEKILDIPIYLQDERLSTKSATDLLITGNVRRKDRKKVVDSVAATIILQSFLDQERRK